MAKLTKWFNVGDQQPTLKGWYDVRWQYEKKPMSVRLWWDGRHWCPRDFGAPTVFGNQEQYPRDCWRGLAEDPVTPKKDAPQAKESEI